MREHAHYLIALVAAVLLSSLLFLPRFRASDEPVDQPAIQTTASAPVAEPSPPPPKVTVKKPDPVPAYVHVNPQSAEACAENMVLVDGIYCPFVGHRCTKFLDEPKDVCQSFAPLVLCEGRLQRRRYCIDIYEYPNIKGVRPAIMMDWNDARRACSVEGKRLCTVEEWEFACEGPQMWPYPYGTERNPQICNIDRHYSLPDLNAFSDPWKIPEEVSRLDQRVASGEMSQCVSPFGVHDMTGNVDEWVMNEQGKRNEHPFQSTLKGGYWGPVRTRCRPVTSTHNEWFRFYQVGFRCCADAKGKEKSKSPAPKSVKIPQRSKL